MIRPSGPESERIDKWLWAARFFRTRALAAAAVRGGKVRYGGARCKPSRLVKAGDQLQIQRGDERFEITIIELNARRLPAVRAALLYEESAASQARRAARQDEHRVMRLARPDFGGRPDKRARRRLRRASGKDDPS